MMGGPKPRKRHALPPGLELLLKTHPPSTSEQSSGSGSSRGTIVFTPFTSLVLPIHWSVIRCIAENRNFRLLSNHAKNRNPRGVGRDPEKSKEEPDGPTSELPPANWSDLVYTDPKTGIKSIELEYKELTAGYKYVVTVIEVVPDEKLYVVCKSDYGDTDKNIESERRTSARKLSTFTCFTIPDYVDVEKLKKNGGVLEDPPTDLFVSFDKIWELQDIVQRKVLNATLDEETPTENPKSPYGSNLTKEQTERLDRERTERLKREHEEDVRYVEELLRNRNPPVTRPIFNPLPVPAAPSIPLHPFVDPMLGRSDLDPFGGGIPAFGSGGMLMDPRGFRSPRLPQGIVPGSRFDPIGPIGGGGGGGALFPLRGRMPGGGAPRVPFGMPNPDHERIPDGFDDMFT